MKMSFGLALAGILVLQGGIAGAGVTNTPPAVLTFHASLFARTPPPALPDWLPAAGYEQGELIGGERPAWQAAASLPEGRGLVWLDLDRTRMNEDLALTLLHEEEEGADLSVQLWDAEGRVVALDLFKNALALSAEARTDTFILPLRQYPTATRIVLHRMSGGLRLFGAVLTPVVTPQDSDLEIAAGNRAPVRQSGQPGRRPGAPDRGRAPCRDVRRRIGVRIRCRATEYSAFGR